MPGRDDQQLADDDADQRAADRNAQAGEDVGQRRGQHHGVQDFALGAAERARDLHQKTVRLLGAGFDGEQLRKHRRHEDEDDQRQLPTPNQAMNSGSQAMLGIDQNTKM